MSLKQLLLATDHPITLRHERWLEKNANATYSPAALAFAQQELSDDAPAARRRNTRFRASSVGFCNRAQVFKAIKMSNTDIIDTKLFNIFHTGNFLHLKWQMAGITEGWLVEAEVAVDNMKLNFGGTLDGILYDGSGFEFKTIHSFGFKSVEREGKPKDAHIRQAHGYMILRPDITKFSVVYENKDNGEWREFRVERDQKIIDDVLNDIKEKNDSIKDRDLPAILTKCKSKEGYEYRGCPFKDVCLNTTKFPGSK